MTRVFLDTSAYSAFRNGHRAILFRIQETPSLVLSPVVLGELRSGFLKGRDQQANSDALRQFLDSPRVEVAPIDEMVAERYALIWEFLRKQGTPIPTNDVWIAAGAMAWGAALLSMDQHFRNVPQVVSEIYSR